MIASIEYNGFTFDSTGASIQAVSGNGLPIIRASSEELSQEYGALATAYLYGSRTIGWSGDLVASSLANYMTLRQNLMGALRPTLLQGHDMVFTLSDGSTRTLHDVVALDPNLDLPEGEPSRTWNSYQVTFRAHFPFFEGSEHDNTQQVTVISGGTGIPTPVPMSLASGASSATDPLIVDNEGNAPAYPTFIVTGPGTLFTIANSTNGQRMTINVTLTAAQQLIIDVRNRTATVGGVSVIDSITGPWIVLDPGENTITLSADSGSTSDTQMQTIFYDTYLGI